MSLLLLPLTGLVLVGTQLMLSEQARANPALSRAAEHSQQITLLVQLSDFPQQQRTAIGTHNSVRADALTERGNVPMLLWLEPDIHINEQFAPGTLFTAQLRLRAQAPANQAAYTASVQQIALASEQPAHRQFGVLAATLRAGLRSVAEAHAGAELVPGLAVGDTALVSKELQQHMRSSSLSHVTAVSGSNTGLVIAFAIWCVSRLGGGRLLRTSIGVLALLAFVTIVGPDPSVQRAAIMAVVLLLGRFGGQPAAALPALGLAMVALLTIDPWQALHPGFALSVAATGGILLIANPIRRWLQKRVRAPGWLALPLAVTIAAQLSCAPLLLLLEPDLPAVGVLANLFAAPAVPLGTGLGLLAAICAPLSTETAHLLIQLAALPATWIAATAEVCAALPAARWNWPGGWVGAALLAGCELCLLLAWALHRGLFATHQRQPWQPQPRRSLSYRNTRALLFAAPLATICAFTLVVPLATYATVPKNWVAVACDVGQGDALLFRSLAAPSQIMLVDTGQHPVALQECLQTFGVDRIALLVLSHDDKDHVGALGTVLSRVDSAMIAPPILGESHTERSTVKELQAAGIPTSIGTEGKSGRLHANGPSWHVLAPSTMHPPLSSNAASLVMHLDLGGATVLLLGDTGEMEQRQLLRRYTHLRADIIKVAHHGSADQDQTLPQAIAASWALISVGADNSYGHPSEATLTALHTATIETLRTDHYGHIAIVQSPDGSLQPWVEQLPSEARISGMS